MIAQCRSKAQCSETKIKILVCEGAAFYGKDNLKMYNTPTHSHGDSRPDMSGYRHNDYFQVRPMKSAEAAYDSLLLRGNSISKSICSLWLFVRPGTENVKHLS